MQKQLIPNLVLQPMADYINYFLLYRKWRSPCLLILLRLVISYVLLSGILLDLVKNHYRQPAILDLFFLLVWAIVLYSQRKQKHRA